MRGMAITYLLVAVSLSPGFFGYGATASAQELRDPMRPPPFALRKFRAARAADKPKATAAKAAKPAAPPLQLTSILYSPERKIAIIDDQMLRLGDRIRGARLIGLTRESARLLRKGKIIDLSLGNDLTAVRKKTVESEQ